MTTRVPVLVCGEPLRGDDAAALAAVRRLPPDVAAFAAIDEVGQLDVLALLAIPPGRPIVVVDAVAGLTPGEVWVRPLAALRSGGRSAVRPRSSHELPIGQALALAAAVRGTPVAGTFVGLAGDAWGLGEPASAAVDAALPAFVDAIAAAIREARRA